MLSYYHFHVNKFVRQNSLFLGDILIIKLADIGSGCEITEHLNSLLHNNLPPVPAGIMNLHLQLAFEDYKVCKMKNFIENLFFTHCYRRNTRGHVWCLGGHGIQKGVFIYLGHDEKYQLSVRQIQASMPLWSTVSEAFKPRHHQTSVLWVDWIRKNQVVWKVS